MKHFFSGMMIALALVLALVIGMVALAENAEPEVPELPAVEDAQTPKEAPEAQTPAESDDSAALREALDAYNSARQSSKLESLESELNGYVAAGKLTQEQADLILNYYKERDSLRNGVCPGCGYQFQNDGGFNRGGRGGKGMGGKGGMGGRGMRGGFNAPTDADTPQDIAPQSITGEGI